MNNTHQHYYTYYVTVSSIVSQFIPHASRSDQASEFGASLWRVSRCIVRKIGMTHNSWCSYTCRRLSKHAWLSYFHTKRALRLRSREKHRNSWTAIRRSSPRWRSVFHTRTKDIFQCLTGPQSSRKSGNVGDITGEHEDPLACEGHQVLLSHIYLPIIHQLINSLVTSRSYYN